MYSKLAVVAVALVAAAGVFADDFTNNCNIEKRICQNGGVCHENVGVLNANAGSANAWKDPFCICQAPYGGNDCSRTIRECKDNPCQNGATCAPADCTASSNNNQYYDCFTCQCPYGYAGSPSYASTGNPGGLCDWKMEGTNCKSGQTLCANGGTCTNQANIGNMLAYSCQCTTGWLGGQTGQTGVRSNVAYNCTVPDCTTSDGACQNGGTCVGGTCSCGAYGGYRCELPRFCDNAAACPDGNTCTNTANGNGFCTAPSFCSTHTCQNGGTCMNSGFPGTNGPYCACIAPADGGNSCNSTLFCQSNPCQNGGTCQNSLSYVGNQGTCSCPYNFAGAFCETPVVGCAAGKAKASDAARCANGFSCSSPFGAVSTCNCGGTTPGGLIHYDCGCNSTAVSRCPGNTNSGGVAGQKADMVCQNGATCQETADYTVCSCRTGFWGDQCQNYDNPCLNNPCENGGQCYVPYPAETQGVALDDRYWPWRCNCKWPFYGKNCEKQAPVPGADGKDPVVCGASNSPCQNGGTCMKRSYTTSPGGFFQADPFTGEDVEAEPWQCNCPATTEQQYGYMGQMCEIQVERCTSSTCQNGGKCSNSGTGPSCTCPCGYAGDRCELPATNINAASVAQFANDGAGGIGYHLEFCSREPCQNGGTCYHTPNGVNFGCNCKSGWAGTYCQWSVRSAAAGVVPSMIAVAAALAVAFALKH